MKQRCMRPKLSLTTEMNLSHTRSFGKGTTSLRLDTLSAVSPTIRNTFSNAYVHPKSASLPGSRSATPVDAKQKPVLLRLEVPTSTSNAPTMLTPASKTETIHEEESASGSSSGSNSSTVSPESGFVPYSLPTHHRSILTNSLLPKTDAMTRIRRLSRPMFALPKQVTFKEPLQEEIRTTRHTFSHYGLVQCIKEDEEKEQMESKQLEIPTLSIETTPLDTLQVPNASEPVNRAPSPTTLRLAEFKFPPPASLRDLISAGVTPPATEEFLSPILFSSPQTMSASPSPISSPLAAIDESAPTLMLPQLSLSSLPHRPVHHQRHLKRDSSSSESSDDNESNSSCAHTPVAGRSKKRRMWVWTLGPLDGYDGPVEPSAFGDELNTKPAEEGSLKPLTIVTTDLSPVVDIDIENSPEVTMKTDELLELDLAVQTPLPMDEAVDQDLIMAEGEVEVNHVNEIPSVQ
jgi:hypothetical protein